VDTSLLVHLDTRRGYKTDKAESYYTRYDSKK
jgi:hypothetical protein